MLQYALNDSKLMIYLFIISIAFNQYLISDPPTKTETDILIDNYFKNLIRKFSENRESVSKTSNKVLNKEKLDKEVMLEIRLQCLKALKARLKTQYNKIELNLLNN